MNNAPTADGGGTEAPRDAEPFFPSEGTFNAVVPLSDIEGEPTRAPLVPVDAADVGQPSEAAWAREAHRAALKDEEETTLVPKRRPVATGGRPAWFVPAVVIWLSIMAGLFSGVYLIRSTQRAAVSPTPAQVAAETPSLPPAAAPTPAPVVEEVRAEAEVEKVSEPAAGDKSGEVAKAESPREAARPAAADEPTPSRPAPPTRTARAAAEAREVAPAPKPVRAESATPARTRATAAAKRQPATPARTLPVSDPPPSAKSRKVIQWP